MSIDYSKINSIDITYVPLHKFLVCCVKALFGIKYLGYFYGCGNVMLITITLPKYPKWLQNWFHLRLTEHEVGHAAIHLAFRNNPYVDLQREHNIYDAVTWHGVFQSRFDIDKLDDMGK
jgi:hypothetical protein